MLTPKQVANMLGVNHRTLDNWRAEKKGPPYYKVEGFIRYKEDEVRQWLETKKQPAMA